MQDQNQMGLRTSERYPVQGNVEVSWHTRSGDVKMARAKCVDFSSFGARILCDQPIDLRTNVYVQGTSLGLLGNASVRYCRRSGLKHMIGLMFSSAVSEAEAGRKRFLAGSSADAEKA